MAEKIMNAKRLRWILASRRDSPFYARRHLAVVPNVSWAMLPWEADLLVLNRNRFLSEVEIKVSLQDWKQDILKAKHRVDFKEWQLIKRFWYAAPTALAIRWQEILLPPDCGVLAVSESEKVTVLKPAMSRSGHRELTETEVMTVMRLAAIKAWGLNHHPDRFHGDKISDNAIEV